MRTTLGLPVQSCAGPSVLYSILRFLDAKITKPHRRWRDRTDICQQMHIDHEYCIPVKITNISSTACQISRHLIPGRLANTLKPVAVAFDA